MRTVNAALAVLSITLTAAAHAAPAAQHWYRCNTHTHTASFPNSDANVSAEYAAQWYKRHGYQCLVITDHEHLTPVEPLNQELGGEGTFLVISGQEVTQGLAPAVPGGAFRWAHVNGINTDKVIYPVGFPKELPPQMLLGDAYRKYAPTDRSPAQAYISNIDAIYEAGGIPQVNHPTGRWGVRLEELKKISRPFLFEVWNAFPSIGPLGGVDEGGGQVPSFEALWDGLLSEGKTVWGVASDDTHDYLNFDDPTAPTPGHAWIVVQAPSLTLTSILDALRRGHFYASTGITLAEYRADRKEISITLSKPLAWKATTQREDVLFTTRFIGSGGRVLAQVTGLAPHYTVKGDEGYVRAAVTDSDGRRAWTQPVFLDDRPNAIP